MQSRSRPNIVKRLPSSKAKPLTEVPSNHHGPRLRPRKSILVVDNEPGVVAVLIEIFSQDGYAVEAAAHGQEALEKLQGLAFDVIVCDIRMPTMDGPTFYRVLAQQAPHFLKRLIFLTADTLHPATHAFLQQVDAPVLEKPFGIQNIREVVAHILHATKP
jgi:CheY-like chemotaxis protein